MTWLRGNGYPLDIVGNVLPVNRVSWARIGRGYVVVGPTLAAWRWPMIEIQHQRIAGVKTLLALGLPGVRAVGSNRLH